MTHKTLTQADLERALTAVGFVAGQTRGQHKVYRHQPTDTVVVLPLNLTGTPLNPLHLVAVRRTLLERGVIDGEAFDRLLPTEAQVKTGAAAH